MNLKEQLQDIINSQKENQNLILEGIEFKKYEAEKNRKLVTLYEKRQIELHEEYFINEKYIKKLEDIIKEL